MVSGTAQWRLLTNMNLGFWGAQIGNGLQTANASAIFESLGADATQLPLLWLGAPLMGFVTQLLVGELSDRTCSRWGRRQPYFLGGALMGATLLIALPLSAHLWQAVILYWALQLALNISVAPARPFVGDLLPTSQHTLGYAVQGFCIGLGTIVAAGLPWLMERVLHLQSETEKGIPATISGAYIIGAVIFLASALWTFWAVKEPLPIPEPTATATTPLWQELRQAIAHMPPIMRQLAGVQALTWAGMYCIYVYLPTAIALNVLGAPHRQSPSYAQGVAWAGICIAFYNLICLGMCLVIPPLSRRWGRVTTHATCLLCGATGLLSLGLMHSRYPVLLAMVGVGIAWASILSIPYALLMDELSATQSGVYMGLFNTFVTLPQIAMSLGFGRLMRTWLHGDRLWALLMGGLFMGLAALAMLRVTELVPLADRETARGDRGTP